MLRKRYLYSSSVVPRRTQYRRRLREHHNRSVNSTYETQKVTQQDVEAAIPLNSEGHELINTLDIVDSNIKQDPCSAESHGDPEGDMETDSMQGTSSDVQNTSVRTVLDKADSGLADLSGADEASDHEADSLSSLAEDSEMEEEIVDAELDTQSGDEERRSESPLPSQSTSTNEDGPPDGPQLNNPLSESTPTTEGDAMLMCLALGLRHSLSWAAMVDILDMINHLFGSEVVKSSKYFFLKHMEAGKDSTMYHVYCPYCERYLGTKQNSVQSRSMVCRCGTEIKDINQASTYFLSLSLTDQLKDLLADKDFVKSLNYRFIRKKLKADAYEDIYDGELYRSLSARGEILWNRFNFSYSFNLDGFPVGGKSGKQTCWPIYVRINELPPHMRSRYMLLAGIFVGKKDPNMTIFLYPFVEEANYLSKTGIDWNLDGKEINSKFIPLCACVDTPARAKLLNMTQFNGWYGCTVCYCKAECIDRNLFYTLPPQGLQERTHEEIILHAAQAHANRRLVRNKKKRSVKGVKGLSPVHTLDYFDLNRGVRPETMHSKLLGNGKQHAFILLESAGKPFYIGSDIRKNAISERLLSIRPPSSVARPPRSLQQVSQWKANEWRSWVLFYGVVCLRGVIPDEYIIHFSMLSTSLHTILQKSITHEELDHAQLLLARYVFMFQQYFGKKSMVYNIHLLLHTKRNIECLGPAWTHTAFGFEAANKTLSQLKKSTSNIAKEIAKKYVTFKSLPALTEKYASSENALKFCEKLSGRSLKSFKRIGATVLLGNGQNCVLNPEEFQSLQNSLFSQQREVLCFEKFIKDGTKFCKHFSDRSHKHDDSFVCIRGETRGRIEKICSISENNEQSVVLFVRELCLNNTPLFRDEFGKFCPIKQIVCDGILLAVRPEDISTQCVAMFLDNGNFICDMPFGCYYES